MGSTLKPGGRRAVTDIFKSVFVQGAYNQGGVLQNFEAMGGLAPGMTVDPLATVGLEEQCVIGGNASLIVIGIAEVDFGIVKDASVAYVATDSIPVIMPHWNPGALLRNLQRVAAGADTHPGDYWGTTSGTPGKIDQDILTGVIIRSQDFEIAATTTSMVGWFETYAP